MEMTAGIGIPAEAARNRRDATVSVVVHVLLVGTSKQKWMIMVTLPSTVSMIEASRSADWRFLVEKGLVHRR